MDDVMDVTVLAVLSGAGYQETAREFGVAVSTLSVIIKHIDMSPPLRRMCFQLRRIELAVWHGMASLGGAGGVVKGGAIASVRSAYT